MKSMTNEEVVETLKSVRIWTTRDEVEEVIDRAVKAVEQKSMQESIIEKIRAEIDVETRIQVKHYTNTDAVIDAVLDVIDKYKTKK